MSSTIRGFVGDRTSGGTAGPNGVSLTQLEHLEAGILACRTTTGSRMPNDDRVPQEERRPGPAGGTTTGSRRRNDDRVPQEEPLSAP